ncbi:MAG TPA: hypothetical protein VF974_03630 [Patescibacteria group bacterium]
MQRYQKPIVVILCLIFITLFLYNTKQDFRLIFKKDLLAHDESSNSVVAANITRKFFPPMVRVNPLNEQQGNWMEGPYWQHIPPMFAYVPYLFFKLDGQVTIEVKRLSFALVTLLTGLLFIYSVYQFRKSLVAAIAATAAAIFWIGTPFTHELITGYAFGVSDIVLAFTVVASFGAVLWYLAKEKETRLDYPGWKLVLIALIVALPIIAKNLLGAIPAATFFILLLRDFRTINKRVLFASITFVAILASYYLPFYISSPETFKNEILVSFLHFKKLEGWNRPWHFYLTNYLPQRYLGHWTWWYFEGLIFGLGIWTLKSKIWDRKDKILLGLSLGWFVWNLIAISLVTSKVPNFIYQSYLLSLFFIVYSLCLVLKQLFPSPLWRGIKGGGGIIILGMLTVSFFVTGYEIVRFAQHFKFMRAQAYHYETEREKFYQVAEKMRQSGVNAKDLVIVHISDNDCWARYPILFLTGAESKTLLEMHFNTVPAVRIQKKYNKVYFLDKDYSFREFNINSLSSILSASESEIQANIIRIKKDKTSCQWLVPDPILNAP